MTTTRQSRVRAIPSGVLPWRGVWRQTVADVAPLVVGIVVVAAAAFMSCGVPQKMDAVATSEVRAALTTQAEPVTVVVTVPITDSGYALNLDLAAAAASMKDLVDAGIPTELRGALARPVTTIVSRELKAGVIAGRPGRVRFIYVSGDSGPAVQWVEGRAPVSTGDLADLTDDDRVPPVEVAVSEAAASIMGVHPGAKLPVETADGQPIDVWLSGVYRATDPGDDAWALEPTLLTPQLVAGGAAVASVGLLVSEQSLPFAWLAVFPTDMTRTYTYRVVPSALDAKLAAQVATQARGLASGRKVFEIAGPPPTVTTQLDRVVDDALARVSAANAQASILLIGLLSVALLVELLTAGLVVERRAAVLVQWRARGATLPAIGLASAVDSTVMATVGGVIGVVAASLAVGGVAPWGWVVPPVVAAALPQPLLAMVRAGRAARTPRPSSNRRNPLTSAHVRRLGAEATVALVAMSALATLTVRGATASADSVWSDVVVLAAPVLVALAVALGVMRVAPHAMRAARVLAARGAGAVPLLAASRARANGLATAALVTAAAVAAIAAAVAGTVNQGQADAAWEAVGADATAITRASAGIPPSVTALDGSQGLTVATAAVISGGQALGARVDRSVTIVAVDAEAMGRLLAATPAPDAPTLALLTTRGAGALPVLVTGGEGWDGVTLRWGDASVTVRTVGASPALPVRLPSQGLVVVVDRALLAEASGGDVPATQAWVVGPDAEARLVAALAGADSRVTTRDGWLAGQMASPVTRALQWLFAGASAMAGALAAVAVVLMAASGSGARTRAVAQMRVVGTSRSAAARVAWIEATIPAVVASTVGIATGIGLAGLLVAALDLPSVTGGLHAPHLVIPWWTLGIPVALGLVARIAVAIASDGSSRRSARPPHAGELATRPAEADHDDRALAPAPPDGRHRHPTRDPHLRFIKSSQTSDAAASWDVAPTLTPHGTDQDQRSRRTAERQRRHRTALGRPGSPVGPPGRRRCARRGRCRARRRAGRLRQGARTARPRLRSPQRPEPPHRASSPRSSPTPS